MDKLRQFQQGDVCIRQLPAAHTKGEWPDARRTKDNIVRRGEATGHAHVVEGTDFALYDLGNRILARIISGDCRIVHEEHGPIELPPGDYEMTPVYEYEDEQSRAVRD